MSEAATKLISETGPMLLERHKRKGPEFLRGYKTALDELVSELSTAYRRGNKAEFRRLYEKSELTKAALAELIGATESAVMAWLKPTTTKSSTAVPSWAVDKLADHLKKLGVV